MSKLSALKNKKTSNPIQKIDEDLTSENLSDALSGLEQSEPARKARKKTNRTIPFSTRVSVEFDNEFRRIAFEKRLKHTELMEEMLENYKKQEL